MPSALAEPPPAPFQSADDVRAAHARLLKELPESPGPGDLARIKEFIGLAVAAGTVLDAPEERKEVQGLIDYWAAMRDLPNHGLEQDLVHPSVYLGHGSVTFTAAGLRTGYTVRNFLTLRMLAKVRALILANAPADP